MSITCRDLTKRSLRKLFVLASGREPTGSQAQDALDALLSIYKEFVGQGVFGRLNPVIITASTYSARENERVVCNNASGVTVTLPDTITLDLLRETPYYLSYDDLGTTASGYDYGRGYPTEVIPRPPRDGAIITVTDLFSTLDLTWIYDGPGARWISIDSLTLSDIAPLTGRYANGLAAILAVRLAPEWSVTPSPLVLSEANSGRSMLSARYDRQYRPVVASYF